MQTEHPSEPRHMPTISDAAAERIRHAFIVCREKDWSVLKASGDGVRDYLQGQITQDMRRLTPDAAVHACLLTPQGKAVSELYLLQGRNDEIVMLTPRDFAETVVARLRRFALGYRLRIGIVDALKLWSVQGAAAGGVLDKLNMPRPTANWLACSRHPGQDVIAATLPNALNGFWCISADAPAEENIPYAVIEARRIIHGFPRFGVEWDATVHPLNANLTEFNGVCFDKGCYVGQEVTSRMHWRGGIRKKLYRVRLSAARRDEKEGGMSDERVGVPAPLLHNELAVGELRSIAANGKNALRGIALLPIRIAEQNAALTLENGRRVEIIEPCRPDSD